MIAHVILFEPRRDLPASARTSLVDTLAVAARAIPGIRRFRVGRRIRHGMPGYEQAMLENFEFILMIEVDDVAALKGYLAHPAHSALGRHFTESAASALAYDYEIVEAGKAESLIGDAD